MLLRSIRIKVPDCAIFPWGRAWPTIVFEFGYTEPYNHLKDDVKLLLEGGGGKISKAIIIKIEPLREGQTEVQSGFVEMWHLKNSKATRDGSRKVIFYHYPISGFTFANSQI